MPYCGKHTIFFITPQMWRQCISAQAKVYCLHSIPAFPHISPETHSFASSVYLAASPASERQSDSPVLQRYASSNLFQHSPTTSNPSFQPQHRAVQTVTMVCWSSTTLINMNESGLQGPRIANPWPEEDKLIKWALSFTTLQRVLRGLSCSPLVSCARGFG